MGDWRVMDDHELRAVEIREMRAAAVKATATGPSFDQLAVQVYSGEGWCPAGGYLEVDVDQWWRFIITCGHGSWTSVSGGLGDPTEGLRRALASAKIGHPS